MTTSKRVRLVTVLVLMAVLRLYTERSALECFAVGLSFWSITLLISRLGYSLLVVELIGALACVEVLLVPVLFYAIAPYSMPLESDTYFRYALPATMALIAGLTYVNHRLQSRSVTSFDTVRAYLKGHSAIGLWMIVIGTVSVGILNVAPVQIRNIANLFVSLLYAGVLYTIFSDSTYKVTAVVVAFLVLGYESVQQGMFGELVAWLGLFMVFWLAGRPRKIALWAKLALVGAGLMILILLQSIKLEYRTNTWGSRTDERKGDAGLMLTLLAERIQHPGVLLDPVFLFSSTARFNQGYFIGHTMVYVPQHEPYANGDVLKYLVAPLIPRFVWPDKPVTGGRDNIRRFTAIQLTANTSVDISPIGEAYVNFGPVGGVVYMLFYGLLFGGMFGWIVSLTPANPTLVLWIPRLFIGCLTKETDLHSEWGGLVHGLVFVFVFYKVTAALSIKA